MKIGKVSSMISSSQVGSNSEVGTTIVEKPEESKQEESKQEEEVGVFNDGNGPIKFTHGAVLKPIPMPQALVDFAKNLPPLPENPVMIPPQCPAPPKNFNEMFRRQTLVFDELQLALIKDI